MIEEALRSACRRGALLAGAAGIVINGRIDTISAEGVVVPNGPPIGVRTRFGVGSITKLVTALAATRLHERGELEMDVPVVHLVPGLVFADRTRGGQITVRHLLSHGSGLPAAGRDWGPLDDDSLRRFVMEDLAHHRFHAGPGIVPCYSSTAFCLAGYVIEVITGTRFIDIISTEIVDPAGMEDTTYPSTADRSDHAWPHFRSDTEWIPESELADNAAGYPSGFLQASVLDLLSLALSVLGSDLIGARSFELLAAPHLLRRVDHSPVPMARASAAYGLGSLVGTWNGRTVVRHGGMQQSFNCSLDLFPDDGSAVILLTNGADDQTFSELLSLCYQVVGGPPHAVEELSVTRTNSDDRSRCVGEFLNVNSGRLIEIGEDGAGLHYREGLTTVPLAHVGDGRYLTISDRVSSPVWFPNGDAPVPYVMVWGEPFLRWELAQWDLSPECEQFNGLYRDTFWPDSRTDLDVQRVGGNWTVTADGEVATGQVVGECQIATDHGLVVFSATAPELQLGNATRYHRTGRS